MSASAPVRVAVVDDHMVVQEGIRATAEREPDLAFAWAATDLEGASALFAESPPDVLLLDLRLGTESSLGFCRTVHSRNPETRVLLFTAFSDRELLRESIQAGASGYILKATSTRHLPEIIRHAVEFGTYFDPAVASDVVRDLLAEEEAEPPLLNGRELEILRMIASGRTNHEIGKALHLSPHTVKFHVRKMMEKLEVRRRTELVWVAAERGLI